MTKTIIINGKEYSYSSTEGLFKIFKKYPNIVIGSNFQIGNYAGITDDFKAGNNFTAGDYFKAGNNFKAGDYFKINHHIILPNSYKYIARCYYEINSAKWYIQLGCYIRTLEEWESDFWNNDNEFPNDGSEKSQKRLETYKLLKYNIEYFKTLKN